METSFQRTGVRRIHAELVELLGAERMTGEGKTDTGLSLDQYAGITTVGIMTGKNIRQGVPVELQYSGHPLFEMRPQLLLFDKAVVAARNTDDPQVFVLRVVLVDRLAEFRPLRIDDPPRQNIDLHTQPGERQADLLDVDELPAEVRVLRPVGIRSVEIALRVQKR